MIPVLICDDHQIVRQGLKQVLADAGDLHLVGEAAHGPELIAQLRSRDAVVPRPPLPVVLLDIALPQRDGLDILKALKAEWPRLPVLMLSTYPDRQYAVRSLKLGAAGYLNKSADAEQMVAAVRKLAAGGLFITPAVAEQLAQSLGGNGSGGERPAHDLLSHREYQVYRLLATGASVGEIAERLVLSPNTVSTYRARILEKTGVRNDVELALYAVRQEAGGVP